MKRLSSALAGLNTVLRVIPISSLEINRPPHYKCSVRYIRCLPGKPVHELVQVLHLAIGDHDAFLLQDFGFSGWTLCILTHGTITTHDPVAGYGPQPDIFCHGATDSPPRFCTYSPGQLLLGSYLSFRNQLQDSQRMMAVPALHVSFPEYHQAWSCLPLDVRMVLLQASG